MWTWSTLIPPSILHLLNNTTNVHITINLFNLCQHFSYLFIPIVSKYWHRLNELLYLQTWLLITLFSFVKNNKLLWFYNQRTWHFQEPWYNVILLTKKLVLPNKKYGERYIGSSSHCSTKQLSIIMTNILYSIEEGLKSHCDRVYLHSSINQMWILKQSKDLLDNFNSRPFRKLHLSKQLTFLHFTLPFIPRGHFK